MLIYVNILDLVRSILFFEVDPYSNEYFFANIGVDTAEKEPLKV